MLFFYFIFHCYFFLPILVSAALPTQSLVFFRLACCLHNHPPGLTVHRVLISLEKLIPNSCVCFTTTPLYLNRNQVGATAQSTYLSIWSCQVLNIKPHSHVAAGYYPTSALATTSIKTHWTNFPHIPGQAEASYTSQVCDSGNSLLTQFSLVLQYFTLHVFSTVVTTLGWCT